MDLDGRTVALYGRFSPGVRDLLQAEVAALGGLVTRDLTRRSDVFVVGSLAAALVDSEALPSRLAAAAARGVPVFAERAFAAALAGQTAPEATLPLATALTQAKLSKRDTALLAAFDLITIKDGHCAFGDVSTLRTASDLMGEGRSLGQVVGILTQARDSAPKGRRKIVVTPSGEAALQWEDGLTTLEGQGRLPLDEDQPSLEDLFEAAALAEADGRSEAAARLYDQCARGDRGDPIALYNYGNIRLAEGAHEEAILAYQRALTRDPKFAEARYNLAQALEAAGKGEAAATELCGVLETDPAYADAVFNLAQLTMKAGKMAAAQALYERYLAMDPPAAWADVARKAIAYCAASQLLQSR